MTAYGNAAGLIASLALLLGSAVAAELEEESMDDAVCAPVLRGHRVNVFYDGAPIYSLDIYGSLLCPDKEGL